MAMWNPWRGCHKHNVELVVVGGESDRNARPLDYAWVLAIREQCITHKVHFEWDTFYQRRKKLHAVHA